MKDAMCWAPVSRFTRCGAYSKKIKCPRCGYVAEVFDFGWVHRACNSCGETVQKYEYTVLTKAKKEVLQ